jgi:phage terminase Nu1 subunit (DNA packaging protein)
MFPSLIIMAKRITARMSLTEARRQLLQTQTRLREVELAEKNGELIRREAVEREWFKLGREVRDALLNIPARLAGIVSAEKNQDKCYALIERELVQCLEALSNDRPNGATRA